MQKTLENAASVIALVSIGRGNVWSVGVTVEAAQAELAGLIGPAQVWSDIYKFDAEDDDFAVIRLPAGDWTGSDADGARAYEVGEIVGYCRNRDALRITDFYIGDIEGDAAVFATVNGSDEVEWLDEDGDIVRTSGLSHLETNRSDVYNDDERDEIHRAMQAWLDTPEAEAA
jgi:hypothetical protein